MDAPPTALEEMVRTHRPWVRGLSLAKLVAFLTLDVLCVGRILGWW